MKPRATPPPSTAPLLRLSEVATRLDVAMRTLHSWIASGRLPVLRFGKRCVRVDPAVLERLIAEARS